MSRILKVLKWLAPVVVIIAWIVDMALGHRDIAIAFAAGISAKWLSETIVERLRTPK
jgi:hypothetical protein